MLPEWPPVPFCVWGHWSCEKQVDGPIGPGPQPACTFAVLDFALGQGVVSQIANLIGLSIASVALVTGYSRGPQPTSWRSRFAW
jgi:hypothetical protein